MQVKQRAQENIILGAAAILVFLVAAVAVLMILANPKIQPKSQYNEAGGQQPDPSIVFTTARPGEQATYGPYAAATPTPPAKKSSNSKVLVFDKNPKLSCNSGADCYKESGKCLSRNAPGYAGIITCPKCVCLCMESTCQLWYYSPKPQPTPAIEVTPVTGNASANTTTPRVASATPPARRTYDGPYYGYGALALDSAVGGAGVYVDLAYNATIPGNLDRIIILLAPGAHNIVIAGGECSEYYDISVEKERTTYLKVCNG